MKHLLHQFTLAACIPLLCGNGKAYAQNLVTNGSFETISTCPPHWSLWDTDYLTLASGWHSFGDTPDLFDTCNHTTVGIPLNHRGFEPVFDGHAYAGVATWTYYVTDYREFIGQALAAPLETDVCYRVSFRISLSDSSRHATNGIGVHFTSNGNFDPYNRFPLTNTPHLFCDSVIHEKQGWQTLSWLFVPDSAYTHIVIGNFFDAAHTQVETLTDGGELPYNVQASYYYIDAVSVERDDACTATVGLAAPDANEALFAWTVPGSGEISVSIPPDIQQPYDLYVTNALGQPVYIETGGNGEHAVRKVPIKEYGLYIVRLITAGSELNTKILLHP